MPSQNRYWVGGSGNWGDIAHWSVTSGGAGGASIPTSSHNVFINASSGLADKVITIDVNGNCYNFSSTTGVSYTITAGANSNINIYGSTVLEVGLSITNNLTLVFRANPGNKTIITNGCRPIEIDFLGKGDWKLQDNLVITGIFYSENGAFDANGYNVTASSVYFYAATGFAPTVYMRQGVWSPARSTWTLDENNGVKVSINPTNTIILNPHASLNTEDLPVMTQLADVKFPWYNK
jgi:hypothetical protein